MTPARLLIMIGAALFAITLAWLLDLRFQPAANLTHAFPTPAYILPQP